MKDFYLNLWVSDPVYTSITSRKSVLWHNWLVQYPLNWSGMTGYKMMQMSVHLINHWLNFWFWYDSYSSVWQNLSKFECNIMDHKIQVKFDFGGFGHISGFWIIFKDQLDQKVMDHKIKVILDFNILTSTIQQLYPLVIWKIGICGWFLEDNESATTKIF